MLAEQEANQTREERLRGHDFVSSGLASWFEGGSEYMPVDGLLISHVTVDQASWAGVAFLPCSAPAFVVCLSNPECLAGDIRSDLRDHLISFFISSWEIAG